MDNAIILTDYTDTVFMPKILGPYKVAHDLRQRGIKTTVINYLHMWDYDELIDYLNPLVNDDTLFIGINNLYYKDIDGINVRDLSESVSFQRKTLGLLLPHGIEKSNEFYKWIKSRNQRLILGGATPADRSENKKFDFIFKGFSEKSLENFIDHLKLKTPLVSSYKSIYGPVIINDINEHCEYDMSHNKMRWDDSDCVLPNETLNIEIGRGCIFKCSFCSYSMIGKKKREHTRSIDNIKEEMIDNYNRFGVTRYYFADNTFNDVPEKSKMIAELSASLPFKLEYFAYLRIDLLEKNIETIKLLYESGLRYIHFGIETMNPKSGKSIGKTMSRGRIIKILNMIKDISNGEIHTHGSFIVGLPHSTVEDITTVHNDIKNKVIQLDSVSYFPLHIDDVGSFQPDQTSQYADDCNSFGIQKISEDDLILGEQVKEFKKKNPFAIPWKHDTFNIFESWELSNKLQKDAYNWQNLESASGLHVASLGLDPKYWFDKKHSEADWHTFVKTKHQRFDEYKQLMWERRQT